jgi:hypothetical protein
MEMREYFKRLVEDGGGEFVDLKDNSVYFRSAPGERIISLYPAALKSPEDVGLALKNCRERKQAQAWELAEHLK